MVSCTSEPLKRPLRPNPCFIVRKVPIDLNCEREHSRADATAYN